MSDFWEKTLACPVCGNTDCVHPIGLKSSPLLIVGDAPGDDEIKQGRPFVGGTGAILRTELAKCGLDMNRMRITNLWLHPPVKKHPLLAKCLEDGVTRTVKEAINRKAILLIGAETVKTFCGVSVSEYNGLVVPSSYFSAPTLVMLQPAVTFHGGGIGEIRFAIRNFKELVKEYA